MVSFNSKVRYAILASVDLARNYTPDAFLRVEDIATRSGAPAKYLGQILAKLKRKALVQSVPGPSGGYRLMRKPDMISVAEVLQAVLSPPIRRGSQTQTAYSVVLGWLSAEMAECDRKLLSQISLADLAEKVAG